MKPQSYEWQGIWNRQYTKPQLLVMYTYCSVAFILLPPFYFENYGYILICAIIRIFGSSEPRWPDTRSVVLWYMVICILKSWMNIYRFCYSRFSWIFVMACVKIKRQFNPAVFVVKPYIKVSSWSIQNSFYCPSQSSLIWLALKRVWELPVYNTFVESFPSKFQSHLSVSQYLSPLIMI